MEFEFGVSPCSQSSQTLPDYDRPGLRLMVSLWSPLNSDSLASSPALSRLLEFEPSS